LTIAVVPVLAPRSTGAGLHIPNFKVLTVARAVDFSASSRHRCDEKRTRAGLSHAPILTSNLGRRQVEGPNLAAARLSAS